MLQVEKKYMMSIVFSTTGTFTFIGHLITVHILFYVDLRISLKYMQVVKIGNPRAPVK